MAFTAEEIKSMQDPDSKIGDWNMSATHSVLLWMENDSKNSDCVRYPVRI
jgi:hypothetical protein